MGINGEGALCGCSGSSVETGGQEEVKENTIKEMTFCRYLCIKPMTESFSLSQAVSLMTQ